MAIYEPIIEALNRSEVRYVVVGGAAVVLHGHPEATPDLAIALAPAEARKAVDTLTSIGLAPSTPTGHSRFADSRVQPDSMRDKDTSLF